MDEKKLVEAKDRIPEELLKKIIGGEGDEEEEVYVRPCLRCGGDMYKKKLDPGANFGREGYVYYCKRCGYALLD